MPPHPDTPHLIAVLGRASAAFGDAVATFSGLAITASSLSAVDSRTREWRSLMPRAVESPERLFAEHTYLSAALKFLGRRRLEPSAPIKDAAELRQVMLGDYFQFHHVFDFAEDDLLTWPVSAVLPPEARAAAEAVLQKMNAAIQMDRFALVGAEELTALCDDILGGAEGPLRGTALSVVQEVDLRGSTGGALLDPAAGTGQRLGEAVEVVAGALRVRGDPPQRSLEHLRDNVVGLQLDPGLLAASRLHYLLALGTLVSGRHPDATTPVYMDLHNAGPLPADGPAAALFRFRTLPFPFEVPVKLLDDHALARRVFGAMYLYLDAYAINSPNEMSFLSAFGAYLQGRKDIRPHLTMDETGVLVGTMTSLRNLYLPDHDLLYFTLLKHAVLAEAIRRRPFDHVLGEAPATHA